MHAWTRPGSARRSLGAPQLALTRVLPVLPSIYLLPNPLPASRPLPPPRMVLCCRCSLPPAQEDTFDAVKTNVCHMIKQLAQHLPLGLQASAT